MMRSPALKDALKRQRQRLAARTFLREAGHLLPKDPKFIVTQSLDLDSLLRTELAARRPAVNGTLVRTEDRETFVHAAHEYFEKRSRIVFNVLFCHWIDAGPLALHGSYLASKAYGLLCFDGDAIYGCTNDVSEVFSLDRTVLDGLETLELFWFRRL